MNIRPGETESMSPQLRALAQTIDEMERNHKVPLPELLDSEFVSEYTDFDSFDELVAQSDWEISSHEDVEAIPEHELDLFVRMHSVFTSYEEMLQVAGKEWVAAQLGE